MNAQFEIAGLRLAVAAGPALLRSVRDRLRCLATSDAAPVDLQVEFCEQTTGTLLPAPAAGFRTVYDPPTGSVMYSEAEDLLRIEVNADVGAVCWPASGRAEIRLRAGAEHASWIAAHPVFTFCLVELLRARQRFNLHAAALAIEGRAVLIAGNSGAGKSTFALTLLRAGFDFLGDDTCFLVNSDPEITIAAFPDEIDVADPTIAFFPELAPLLRTPPRPGADKRPLLPEQIYSVTFARTAHPAVLLFPTAERGEQTRIEPMTPAEALLELAPNVLLTDQARARAHLSALSDLVAQATCYRVSAGRDFAAVPARIAELLGVPAAL